MQGTHTHTHLGRAFSSFCTEGSSNLVALSLSISVIDTMDPAAQQQINANRQIARARQDACYDLFAPVGDSSQGPYCTAVTFVTHEVGLVVVLAPNNEGIHGAKAAQRVICEAATRLRSGGDISSTEPLPNNAQPHQITSTLLLQVTPFSTRVMACYLCANWRQRSNLA